MKSYVIVPECSDLNRGDQALLWETRNIAQRAGFNGQYFLTAEANEPVWQSEAKGFSSIRPLLEHPSRFFKNDNNTNYSLGLKLKWGLVAICDLFVTLLLLTRFKPLIRKFLSEDKNKSIDTFENADAIFFKGGGLLQTYGGVTSTYSMYYFVYSIFFAASIKKPVYVMPNSFGPFEGPFVKWILKRALNNCTLITAREEKSAGMLKDNLDIHVPVFPDLAFNLPVSGEVNKTEFKNELHIPKSMRTVAITVRPYRFPEADNPKLAYQNFKQEMATFLISLHDSGFMPILIEHTRAVSAHENDGQCISEIIDLINDTSKYRVVSNSKLNCEELKTIYGNCDYIVGTRFHSVIFSLGQGVPSIAISYSGNKTTGIMKEIGLDDYVLDINNIDSNILMNKFKSIVEHDGSVRNQIQLFNSKVESELLNLCNLMRGE